MCQESEDRPDTERYGLALIEFAVCRVDISHTWGVKLKL